MKSYVHNSGSGSHQLALRIRRDQLVPEKSMSTKREEKRRKHFARKQCTCNPRQTDLEPIFSDLQFTANRCLSGFVCAYNLEEFQSCEEKAFFREMNIQLNIYRAQITLVISYLLQREKEEDLYQP